MSGSSTGTPVPITCPDGSYTLDSERGNEKESDCTPCDTGKYCTGGQIQVLLLLFFPYFT